VSTAGAPCSWTVRQVLGWGGCSHLMMKNTLQKWLSFPHCLPQCGWQLAFPRNAAASCICASCLHANALRALGFIPTTCRQEPLVGSLFWRWAFMVYSNDVPGPHGVSPHQTTFGLVRAHTQRLRHYAASRPPRPGCQLGSAAGCWVPESSLGGVLRRCAAQLRAE
jgi:hypothetical protein